MSDIWNQFINSPHWEHLAVGLAPLPGHRRRVHRPRGRKVRPQSLVARLEVQVLHEERRVLLCERTDILSIFWHTDYRILWQLTWDTKSSCSQSLLNQLQEIFCLNLNRCNTTQRHTFNGTPCHISNSDNFKNYYLIHTWQELSLWSRNDAKPFDIIFWSYQVWTSWKTPSHNYLCLYTKYHIFKMWFFSVENRAFPHIFLWRNHILSLCRVQAQIIMRWCFSWSPDLVWSECEVKSPEVI